MKKGLTTALLTVAVAMLAVQAMAMAPVIGDVPSPIVGNAEASSGPTGFVYPDAFNLNNVVTDDTTAAGDIKWSYEIVGTPHYNINNVAPINSTSENPVTPGAKQINSQVGTGELNPDNNPATITIRNVVLSPLAGGGAAAGTNGAENVIPGETQAVTLYASDGTTYSAKTVFFYTDNGGSDRISQPAAAATPVRTFSFTGTAEGMAFGDYSGGSVTSSTSSGTAICMTSPQADGGNYAFWYGQVGDFPLTKNAVYHLRAKVNSSQTTPNTVPFWDIVIDNGPDNGGHGMNLYGYDMMFFDNEGGANAALSDANGGKSFHLWFAPMPVGTAAWNDTTNGAFNAANAGGTPNANAARLQFRMLDVGTGVHAATAFGTLCLTDLVVERFDLSAMQTIGNVYDNSNMSAATSSGGTTLVAGFFTPTVTFTSGDLTVTPSTAGRDLELVTIDPATNLLYDLANPSTIADNYPVAWTSNTLYQITVDMAAPDANSETNPWDCYEIGMDGPSNEVIVTSFVTATKNGATNVMCGTPKQGTAQTYMQFFYTHNESASSVSQFHFLRPRVTLINVAGLTVGNNSGGVTISSIKVNKVSFAGATQ
jgi:hypothetical protein